MNTVLILVQIATLVALIIYVWKTWQMASAATRSVKVSEGVLKEMKESRAEEVAPYVVAYFDIPHGKPQIYLVVKNIGKSIARDVKLECQPQLRNEYGEEINEITLMKDGIASLPPGYEIRTLFGNANVYLDDKKEFPLTYKVKISYSGGLLPDTTSVEQVMDLSAFKHTVSIREKGMHELVEEVKKLVTHNDGMESELERLANTLANGIWLKNPDFLMTDLRLESDFWKPMVLAKLNEFKMLWASYGREREKRGRPFYSDLKNRSALIGAQILAISSRPPSDISPDLINRLVDIVVKLSELSRARFFLDGGRSVDAFNTLGDSIATLIDEFLKWVDASSH
jgi:hypothetical protein